MTEDMIKELIEKGAEHSAKEWSDKFEVEVHTIRDNCKRYNIELKKVKNHIDEEEAEYIRENGPNMTIIQLAEGIKKELGIERNKGSIKSFVKDNKIEIKKNYKNSFDIDKIRNEVNSKQLNENTEIIETDIKEVEEIEEEVTEEEVEEEVTEEVEKVTLENDLIKILNKYSVMENLHSKLIDEIKKSLNDNKYGEVSEIAYDIETIEKYM